MSTRSRGVRYGMAMVLVLWCASIASAQPSGREPGKGESARQEKFEALFKELNLSPEQQQKIADQRNQEKEQAQVLRQKIASTRSQLSQELDQPNPDKAKVYALVAQMKELMGKRMEQRVERILSLKEVLTPEQFKVFNQRGEQFGFKKEGGREKARRNGACRGKFGDGDKYV